MMSIKEILVISTPILFLVSMVVLISYGLDEYGAVGNSFPITAIIPFGLSGLILALYVIFIARSGIDDELYV